METIKVVNPLIVTSVRPLRDYVKEYLMGISNIEKLDKEPEAISKLINPMQDLRGRDVFLVGRLEWVWYANRVFDVRVDLEKLPTSLWEASIDDIRFSNPEIWMHEVLEDNTDEIITRSRKLKLIYDKSTGKQVLKINNPEKQTRRKELPPRPKRLTIPDEKLVYAK